MRKTLQKQAVQLLSPKQLTFLQEVYTKNTCLYYYPRCQLIIEQHIIEIPYYQFEIAKQDYKNRFESKLSICQIYHIEIIKQTRSKSIISVYTQRLETQLSDIKQLKIKQVLKIIKNFIKTLEHLTNIYGYFQLSNRMIGMNNKKKWKLWINQNFSLNVPQIICSSQSQMIKSLLNVFQQHTKKQYRSQLFYKEIDNIQLSLKNVQEFINQFSIKEQIQVPLFIYNKKNESKQQEYTRTLQRNLSKSHNGIFNKNQTEQKLLIANRNSQLQKDKQTIKDKDNSNTKIIKSTFDFSLQGKICKSLLKNCQQLVLSQTQASTCNLTNNKISIISNIPKHQKKSNLQYEKSHYKNSNCWSGYEQRIISEQMFSNNNWNVQLKSLNCLQSNSNIKYSIYLDIDEDNLYDIQRLNKLKQLNKYGKQGIYKSIIQEQFGCQQND